MAVWIGVFMEAKCHIGGSPRQKGQPMTNTTALFDFMVVRAAGEVGPARMRRGYVRDPRAGLPRGMATHGRGAGGLVGSSTIAEIVAERVAAWKWSPDDPAALAGLRDAVIARAADLGMIARDGIVPGSQGTLTDCTSAATCTSSTPSAR